LNLAVYGSCGWLGAGFWTLAGREETGRGRSGADPSILLRGVAG
jgi:hypothetical protein